jgi:hypothetical protein
MTPGLLAPYNEEQPVLHSNMLLMGKHRKCNNYLEAQEFKDYSSFAAAAKVTSKNIYDISSLSTVSCTWECDPTLNSIFANFSLNRSTLSSTEKVQEQKENRYR